MAGKLIGIIILTAIFSIIPMAYGFPIVLAVPAGFIVALLAIVWVA